MKKLKYLIALGISLIALSFSSNIRYQSVKADNEEIEDKVIYIDLDLNNKYLEEDAHPYIHYFNGEDKNVSLSLISNNIYSSTESIPLNVFNNEEYGFEICSFEGTYKTDMVTNSKLKDINYNYICLSSEDNPTILNYGYYGEKLKETEATYKTQRVWLYNPNNNFYSNDDWGNKCINVVGYEYEGKWYENIMSFVVNTYDSRTYFYTDIPYELTSLHFLKSAASDNHSSSVYEDIYVESLQYGVCYFMNEENYTAAPNIVGGATAIILGRVVEAYLTYGKANSNGATTSTMKNVYATWFANKSATSSELKNEKIKDYTGYSSNNNSYDGLEKGPMFSVNEKWNTMCSQAGIDPKTGQARGLSLSWLNISETGVLLIIGGIALLTVCAVIFLMFRRTFKRRKD